MANSATAASVSARASALTSRSTGASESGDRPVRPWVLAISAMAARSAAYVVFPLEASWSRWSMAVMLPCSATVRPPGCR